MSESWFASKGDTKEEVVEELEKPSEEQVLVEDQKPKPKRGGFSLFRAKAKSPDTSKKSGFSLFRKKSPQPKHSEEEEREEGAESEKDLNKEAGFSFFNRNKDEDKFEEDGKNEEEDAAVEKEEDREEEDEEDEGGSFENSMRNVLRKLGVEVEDDDDWKQMVIKTRLTLKDFKDSLVGNKGTKEERTRRLIVVFNDENVVELQFRLDFAHYSPPNLDIEDEDEVEIQPDLTGLETPVNPEKPAAKKKRLKRIIKAITKSQKLNKKRLKRLEEKQLVKAQEEKAQEAEEAKAKAEEKKAKAVEEAKAKEAEAKVVDEGDQNTDVFEDEESEVTADLNKAAGEGAEQSEEAEEEDTKSLLGKIEDQTGIRIIIRTEGLEERLNEHVFMPLKEYKEIFFGPDLTDEEKAELEKIANDEKEFYIHLKLLCRKKTLEEKEAERLAAEEEEKRKAEEEDAKTKEKDEEVVLEEADERKIEKRKELEKKREGLSESEGETEATSIDYDNVQIS